MSTRERERRRPDPRSAPRQVVKLVVSYHGKGFFGSQRQGDKRTVQGEIEEAVALVTGIEIPVYLAGRTDQGVHAVGQVASYADHRPDLRNDVLLSALNAHLEDDVAVTNVERRPFGFHARYDAKWRSYRYRIWCGTRQPVVADTVVHRPGTLDLAKMSAAAGTLVGTHDVASFAGGGEGVPGSERQAKARGTVRTIYDCDVRRIEPWWGAPDGQLIEIAVTADGFLPRMVRTIAGALIEIGRGSRPPGWIEELIAGRDRRLGPMTAPAHGLILWRVGYDDDPRDAQRASGPIGVTAD